MNTAMTFSLNEAALYCEMEADLSSGAAVTAVRGTNVTCTKTGTGTYAFVIKGTGAIQMYEVLNRFADLGGAPATAFWAKVTSIVQSAATGDITINVTTLNNAATPAATDVTAVCTLSCQLCLRIARMGNPF